MEIDRTELVAFILLGIGVALLISTFYMAYTLIVAELGIFSTPNLSEALGEILGPIAEAVIKVMYLSIMGWTGSIATMRGIQLIREARRVPVQQLAQEKEESTKTAERSE